MTVGVVYIEDGKSSLIKVTVPQSGISEGLALAESTREPEQQDELEPAADHEQPSNATISDRR